MNLTRILTIAAAAGVLATAGVSAGTIRHAGSNAHKYQIIHMGATGGVHNNLSCPPTYFACVSPTKASPYLDGWCVSSTGNCSSGLVGDWDWSSAISKIGKGKGIGKVSSTWSPDPGNPSTNTIADKRKKAKGTKLIGAVSHSTCETTTGSCFSNFVTYAVTN